MWSVYKLYCALDAHSPTCPVCRSTWALFAFCVLCQTEIDYIAYILHLTVFYVLTSVPGVFLLFALVIMMVKVSYVQDNEKCHCIDEVADTSLCPHRHAELGYSVALAWVAVVFFILAFMCWLLLSRCIRLEKAKSLI